MPFGHVTTIFLHHTSVFVVASLTGFLELPNFLISTNITSLRDFILATQNYRVISTNASSFASIIRSKCASVSAVDRNIASNWLGPM